MIETRVMLLIKIAYSYPTSLGEHTGQFSINLYGTKPEIVLLDALSRLPIGAQADDIRIQRVHGSGVEG